MQDAKKLTMAANQIWAETANWGNLNQ